MKQIVAFIKPHKLDDVILALHSIEGLTGTSISDVRGFGRDRSSEDLEQEQKLSWDVAPHVKLDTFCPDDLVEDVVSAIQNSAHTGLRGDGKIYVSNVAQAIRISNGQRGEDAV